MENSMLVGLTRQMMLKREMSIISNNLANMNTTGFKAESPVFHEFLIPVAQEDVPDRKISFVIDQSLHRNLAEGRLETTDNPLDMAISGKGYFKVETDEGIRYTRDGHFTLDDQGRLTTSQGNPVLTSAGASISFSSEDGQIFIAADGSVSTLQGARGKIGLVSFENERLLKKTGDNLLETNEAELPVENVHIIQGALESSNVEPIGEMTRMIDVLRAYSSAAKIADTASNMQRRAISRLARVNS